VYAPGFMATNSGVMPEPGLSYSNTFLDYSFNQVKCPLCGPISSEFNAAAFLDVNLFMWVSKRKILGANPAIAAAVPVLSNSALSLAGLGPIVGSGGLSDTFYQPLALGWHLKRLDATANYMFFAPTGRFTAGATNNTGTGHWTNAPATGETFYLTENKATALSTFLLYEFHTTQGGTNIHPGQTLDLDYSLTQIVPLQEDQHTLLQFDVSGYGQWQTTNNSGPGVDPKHPGHYIGDAIGIAANIILPVRKSSVGVKLMQEYSNSNTVEGYSFQVTGGITF